MSDLPNCRLLGILRTPNKELLGWGYREHIQGWIYHNIGHMADSIHKAPYSLFTFSLSASEYQVVNTGLVSDTWMLRIASAHQEILDNLENKLARGMNICGIKFQPVIITKELLSSSSMLESNPIVTFHKTSKKQRNPFKQVDEYQDAVTTALANRWFYHTGTPAPEILFTFRERPRPHKVQYKNRRLIGYAGGIELRSTPEIIQFAQCVGLGSKTSCGLGMVV